MTDITQMLSMAQAGDPASAGRLWAAVYGELKKMAAGRMAGEKRQVTLQATVLVHEVWMRLAGPNGGEGRAVENRAHFFSAAAEVMRRILVDQARRRLSQKRGAGEESVPWEEAQVVATAPDEKLVEVNGVLDELAQHAPRQAEIVRLHFFVGLTHDEIAALLSLSESTVRREWMLAKAWLFQAIRAGR